MPDDDRKILPFPLDRAGAAAAGPRFRELGMTPLAKLIDATGNGTLGHWCSRCRGVWYGRVGEAECPVCGNRHG